MCIALKKGCVIMNKNSKTPAKNLSNENAQRYCNIVDILMAASSPLTYSEIQNKLKCRNYECSYKIVYNLMCQISRDYPVTSQKRGKADEFFVFDNAKRAYLKERLKNLTACNLSINDFDKLMKIVNYLSTDNADEKLDKALKLLKISA